MGRTLGSKNKPKVTSEVKDVPAVKVAIKKEEKILVPEIDNVKYIPNVVGSQDGYMPLSMTPSLFNEHRLNKAADYLLCAMTTQHKGELAKEAAKQGVSINRHIINEMLKSLSFNSKEMLGILLEVDEYKKTNKPIQLYIKYRKT